MEDQDGHDLCILQDGQDGPIPHVFQVGDLVVPLFLRSVTPFTELEDGSGGSPDETGAVLWPTSTLIASLVLRCALADTDVLELGCGTGFCGLVAQRSARRVVLSDREPSQRALASRNALLQPGSPPIDVEPFGWDLNDRWPAEKFGVVLASDVLYGPHVACRYDPETLERFVRLLDWSLAPGGTVLLGHVERNCRGEADLLDALQRKRFAVRVLEPSECVSPELLARGNAFLRCGRALVCQ